MSKQIEKNSLKQRSSMFIQIPDSKISPPSIQSSISQQNSFSLEIDLLKVQNSQFIREQSKTQLQTSKIQVMNNPSCIQSQQLKEQKSKNQEFDDKTKQKFYDENQEFNDKTKRRFCEEINQFQIIYANQTKLKLNDSSQIKAPIGRQKPRILSTKIHSKSVAKDHKQLQESDSQNNKNLSQEREQLTLTLEIFPSEKISDYFTLINENPYESQSKDKQFSILSLERLAQNYLLIGSLVRKLKQHNIKILKQPLMNSGLAINHIMEHADYEIIEMDIRIGSFQKTIKIYNILTTSCFHSLKPDNSGSFGNIYCCQFFSERYVVKCIQRKIDKKRGQKNYKVTQSDHAFRQILQQYLITYIAGVLGIGPKILSPFGFDLVVSNKCIQFFMQQCEVPNLNVKNFQIMVAQMKQSLYHLHLLNIVHNDIKPENIMYSRISKKLILIDFGLSKYLMRPLGFKAKTFFVGTYQYCHPQMQNLLLLNEYAILDLYYNDAYGLNQSMNRMPNINIEFLIEFNKNKQPSYCYSSVKKNIDASLQEIYLKFLILTQNTKKAIEIGDLIEIKKKPQIQLRLLDFITKLPDTTNLQPFYCQCLLPSIRKDILLNKIVYHKRKCIEGDQLSSNDNLYNPYQQFYGHLQSSLGQINQQQQNQKQKIMLRDQIKIILTTDEYSLSNEDIWFIFLEFINFMKKNDQVSIEDKAEVSKSLIKKFNIEIKFCLSCETSIPKILQPIFECLYHLLNECFEHPLNKWGRSIMFQVMLTMIMMGWMIPKHAVLNWKYYLISSCYEEELPETIMWLYLKFLFIIQIYQNRFFMFHNGKCVEQIEKRRRRVMNLPQQQPKQQVLSLYNFYLMKKDFFEQKKEQVWLYRMLTDMLCSQEYPGSNTQKNLDNMLNLIESLKPEIFSSRTLGNEVMRNLLFWIMKKYMKSMLSNGKIGQLINRVSLFGEAKISAVQIYIYHFEFIHMNLSSNIMIKFRQLINHLDRVINCPIISDCFMTPYKLLLCYEDANREKAKQYFGNIYQCKMTQGDDAYLVKYLGIVLRIILFHLFGANYNSEWVAYFRDNIEDLIDGFIFKFEKHREMWKYPETRQNFSCIVTDSVLMSPMKVLKGSIYAKDYHKRKLAQNVDKYLQILEQLCVLYPDRVTIMKLIEAKIYIYQQNGRWDELNKFLENEKRFDFQTIDHQGMNLHKVGIYVAYLSHKISNQKKKLSYYRGKMIELYQKLAASKSYSHIFMNISIGFCILEQQTPPDIIIDFLQSVTKFVTDFASKSNLEILMRYLLHLNHSFYCADFATNPQQNSLDQTSPYYIIKNRPQLSVQSGQLQRIYEKFRLSDYFDRAWENPYIIMIAYLVAFECEIQVNEIKSLNIKIVKIMNSLAQFARNLVLIRYYGFTLGENRYITRRKKQNLTKKLIRVTLNLGNFDYCVSVRLPQSYVFEGFKIFKQGFQMVKQKHRKYIENSQISRKNILLG